MSILDMSHAQSSFHNAKEPCSKDPTYSPIESFDHGFSGLTILDADLSSSLSGFSGAAALQILGTIQGLGPSVALGVQAPI